MIKLEFTDNYTGINISGDYEDLDFLYDSIHYLIKGEPKNLMEEAMQDHLYGFLYEVRHCYQGDRDFKFVYNELRKETRELCKIPKQEITDNNLYYSFNYILTDLFIDMLLIKYFISRISNNEKNIYNPYLNNVSLFYSFVFNQMQEVLTETKLKKLQKGLLESVINDKIYYPQWFETVTCDYLKQSKEKRLKNLSKTLDAIYNYGDYQDYLEMKIHVEKYCKENDCLITDVRTCEYPEELEW